MQPLPRINQEPITNNAKAIARPAVKPAAGGKKVTFGRASTGLKVTFAHDAEEVSEP